MRPNGKLLLGILVGPGARGAMGCRGGFSSALSSSALESESGLSLGLLGFGGGTVGSEGRDTIVAEIGGAAEVAC